MAHYQVGSIVQFVRSITRTDPERVINLDEKGRIVDISDDGKYSVQLFADENPVAGILEEDIQPSVELRGDGLPGDNHEPDVTSAQAAQDSEQG